jgi:hypothetical protein
MNLRKIIFVLCANLILTSCLNLSPNSQNSETPNESKDSNKSKISDVPNESKVSDKSEISSESSESIESGDSQKSEISIEPGDSQKSEVSYEPKDSDKSNILQDSIDTQKSALLGWWGPELPDNPSKEEFFEYNCFGKGGLFHFLELGYQNYYGKDVLYQVNWFKGTWISNGNNLEIKWETVGYIHSDTLLDADWKSKMEWETDHVNVTVEFFVSDQQLILAKGTDLHTDQRAQEIDPLKDICVY